MLKKQLKGFTIIEVVLVLAIAGLIFLMVFIAVPALQRSQRDTDRKNTFSALGAAAITFMSNNRGAMPTATQANLTALARGTGDISDLNCWGATSGGTTASEQLNSGCTFAKNNINYELRLNNAGTGMNSHAGNVQDSGNTLVIVVVESICHDASSTSQSQASNFVTGGQIGKIAVVGQVENGTWACFNAVK